MNMLEGSTQKAMAAMRCRLYVYTICMQVVALVLCAHYLCFRTQRIQMLMEKNPDNSICSKPYTSSHTLAY